MQDDKPDSTLRDRGDPGYTIGEIRNKIYGAPREKHSVKVPKMAGPEDLSPEQLNLINDGLKKGELYLFFVDEHSDPPKNSATLPAKQQDIIYDLAEIRRALDKSSGLKEDFDRLGEEDHRRIEMLREEYFNFISEAVRAGLIWHPWVYDFVYTRKALGDKEYLRKIKRGWETGVRRPIKMEDVKFILNLDKIVEYRQVGKTWKEIRRWLMKRKIMGIISPQGLENKVKKAWEARWAKFNLKAPPIP